MKYKYAYFNTPPGELKYGIKAPQRVVARYTKSNDPDNNGIRHLEALPESLPEDLYYELYYKEFKGFIDKNASKEDQMEQVHKLSEFRLPLDFTSLMEEKLHLLLIKSYRQREEDLSRQTSEIFIDDMKILKNSMYMPSIGGDSNLGLSIIGEGGSGKSTAVKQMLSHYPQVIIHDPEGPDRDIQIVWIAVTTSGTGSLQEMYIQICAAVDHALRNKISIYKNACEKEKRLSGMANLVAHLVQQYSIGVIAIDEIQSLAGNNKMSSYDTLLQITNTTKCVIMPIGTEAALKTIFSSSHQSRRSGYKIRASEYTREPESVRTLIQLVTQINWFENYSDDVPFEPTEQMINLIYNYTFGFIERIIELWIEIQCDYIRRIKKPEITVEYFEKIANLMYSRQEQENKKQEIQSNALFKPAENALLLGNEQAEQYTGFAALVQNSMNGNIDLDRLEAVEAFEATFDPHLALSIYDRVCVNIADRGHNYAYYKIKECILKVMRTKTALTLSEDKLVAKTIAMLEKNPQTKLARKTNTVPPGMNEHK